MRTRKTRFLAAAATAALAALLAVSHARETVPTPGQAESRVSPVPSPKKGIQAKPSPTPRRMKTPAPAPTKTPQPKKKKKAPSPTPTVVPAGDPAVEAEDLLDGGAVMGLNAKEISRRVDAAQAAMKDVRMELKMEMKDALSGVKQNVRGVVVMKNPGKVFVHYTHPIEQFLYIRDDVIQMYQPTQNMVYKQKAGKGGEPVYLGVGHELNQYMAISRVSVVQETSEEVTLLLVPKVSDALFERMRVVVNKRTWWPVQVRMQSPSVETKATFQKFRFDEGVPDSTFEFSPPDDAQTVEGAVF